MIVEQSKYANKEPLFASAVTKLYLGERSLLLLSFSPILIDSLCCIKTALALYNKMVMDKATHWAGKASCTVLYAYFFLFIMV